MLTETYRVMGAKASNTTSWQYHCLAIPLPALDKLSATHHDFLRRIFCSLVKVIGSSSEKLRCIGYWNVMVVVNSDGDGGGDDDDDNHDGDDDDSFNVLLTRSFNR